MLQMGRRGAFESAWGPTRGSTTEKVLNRKKVAPESLHVGELIHLWGGQNDGG